MIFDAFIFFNEIDLLEIRLNELSGVIDRFIIVESSQTFTGKKKRLFFADNKARFHDFLERIIHIVVDDMPDGDNPWPREAHQRNAILRGLSGARDDDIVIISDVDEIPRASVIKGVHLNSPANLVMRSFGCYVNSPTGPWTYARIAPVHACRSLTPQVVRHAEYHRIEDAGWHFSSVGGASMVGEKMDAFSHQEPVVQQFNNRAKIEAYSKFGFGLLGGHIYTIPIDDSFPEFLVRNQKRFANLIGSVLPYESYLERHSKNPSGSVFSGEELEWIYHVAVGLESARFLGSDSEAIHALSKAGVQVFCEPGEMATDIVFVEDPSFYWQHSRARKILCGLGYAGLRESIAADYGRVDRIGELWVIVKEGQ